MNWSKVVKITAVATILLLSFFSVEGAAHTPHDRIMSVAVSPAYQVDNTVICSLSGQDQFILKSTDGGETWNLSMIGLVNSRVSCLEFSPNYYYDQIAFAATEGGHILKSVDCCESWTVCNAGLTEARINTLAVSPEFSVDQTLYFGTYGDGLFRSTDGGSTWAPMNTGITDLFINTIAISPDFGNDQIVYVGSGGGIDVSQDGGATWVNLLSGGISVTGLAISHAYALDHTLFASTWGKGILKSTNSGGSWSKITPSLYMMGVALSPHYFFDQTVYALTKEEVIRSEDGGNQWAVKVLGLDQQAIQTDTHYFDFGFSPNFKNDKTLYLASWEGVYRSQSRGEVWTHLEIYNVNFIRGISISPDFANDGTMVAGAYGGGVYKSTDRGATWEAADTGLSDMYLRSKLVFSPDYAQDGTIFSTSCWGQSFDKTTQYGSAWFQIMVDPQDVINVRAIAVSPDFANDQTLFMGNGYDGQCAVYKSSDGGASFVPLDPFFKGVKCLEVSPNYPVDKTIFATNKEGIYRSVDDGITWTDLGVNDKGEVFALAISPSFSTDGTLFIGATEEGVLKSTDSGDTWVASNSGITDNVIEDIALSPDFQTDQSLFAATKSGGLFKSTDGGANWVYCGLEGTFLQCMAVSPDYTTDQTLYLGSWDSLYMSTDGGSTFNPILDIYRYSDTYPFVYYIDTWSIVQSSLACSSYLHYSSIIDAHCYFKFTGDSISWIGAKAPNAGVARIKIDGAIDSLVDLYSPQIEMRQVLYTKNGLGPGFHSIRIEVTRFHNPNTTGRVVTIDAFEVGE